MSVNVFGVKIVVELWTVILMVLVFFDAFIYIKKRSVGLSKIHYIVAAGILVVLAVISLIAHEAGHALASTIVGNPINQAGISWWGAYVMPQNALSKTPPLHEIFVAMAGPAMNFAIALICVVPVKMMGESLSENSIQYLSYINIRLGRLNLFPILILDGGKVLDGLLRLFFNNSNTVTTLGIVFGTAFIAYYFFFRGKKPVIEDKLDTL